MNQDNEKNNFEEKKNGENDLFSLGHIQSTQPEPKKEETLSSFRSTEAVSKTEDVPAASDAAPTEKASFKTFPERPVRGTVEESVSEPPPPVKRRSLRSTAASLGALLSEARNNAGLSVEKVAEATRVRMNYINALESDNLSSLPSVVYIKAYVRALIKLYDLDNKSLDMINEYLQELEPPKDVPEKLLEDLGKDVQISKDEAKKVRMILFYTGGIILLLISLTITSIIAINIRNSKNHQRQTQLELRPYESKQMEKLLPQQIPEMKTLKVPPPK